MSLDLGTRYSTADKKGRVSALMELRSNLEGQAIDNV